MILCFYWLTVIVRFRPADRDFLVLAYQEFRDFPILAHREFVILVHRESVILRSFPQASDPVVLLAVAGSQTLS